MGWVGHTQYLGGGWGAWLLCFEFILHMFYGWEEISVL